ncbi:MAG TPA: hypothetical protein PKE04_08680, partial [Clostridia bacterium]|nr:hypothetical protein [Clostridia bacterium]
METDYPNLSNDELLQRINEQYGVRAQALWLHRDSGGRVYYLQCPEGRKVFKLYRPLHTGAAIQSTQILTYLERNGFPVVRTLPTLDGCPYISLAHEPEQSIGILFEFAKGKCIGFLHRWRNGTQPLIHPKAKLIGQSLGRMHRLMEGYGGPLAPKGRAR